MLPLFGQVAKGVRSYTALNQLNLSRCGLNDQGISVVANALFIRNASLRELDLNRNGITSAGLHACALHHAYSMQVGVRRDSSQQDAALLPEGSSSFVLSFVQLLRTCALHTSVRVVYILTVGCT
jgi:Ran GTPase-activating protein (RanGAP) involved in mRNA processing and transport